MQDVPITHPETAWIATSVPLWATIAVLLAISLIFHGRLRATLHSTLTRYASAGRGNMVDPALLWIPPIASEAQFLTSGLIAVLASLFALYWLANLFVALILAGPATMLVLWLLLWLREQHYRTTLDQALPAAVGRLGAQLRAGSGVQPALERVIADMPTGPLRAEWSFILGRLGTPLANHSLATAGQVVAALAAQTPSARHATFLGHLEVALDQTHDVLTRRVMAAYSALQAAEQRRSQAATELAQMRYSGLAISLAGLGMAIYLVFTQQERFLAAYQGAPGLIAGAVVVSALIAPLIGGMLLARAEELDY